MNESVVIEFMPAKTGDIAFALGMNMLQGTVVVERQPDESDYAAGIRRHFFVLLCCVTVLRRREFLKS